MITNSTPPILSQKMCFGSMMEIFTIRQYGGENYTVIFEIYNLLIGKDWIVANW
jgi:hypothetical protein